METKFTPFSLPSPRPLPVILLADVSGSMAAEGKIQALNQAVRDMIAAFAAEDDLRAEIHVGIITFGGTAQEHTPLQPARQVQWADMQASGWTPLGGALELARALIEDKDRIPSRAYRPTVVLVSDGQPNDAWQDPLNRFVQEGRASKADRMALAIGSDADETMLRLFLADPEKQVYHADDARRIRDFFRFVTMTVTQRSRSTNPNLVPPPAPLQSTEF